MTKVNTNTAFNSLDYIVKELNLHASSMNYDSHSYHFLHSLYDKYRNELVEMTSLMRTQRQFIENSGYRYDFADVESELLYLMVRELNPEIVVEISPCHGYSTNYILAAMTKNKKGSLFSYEISENVHGRPITDVILSNILDGLDKERLNLCIGDATKVDIPTSDFLFIDSCHEAWFAAWYMEAVVPKAKMCLVHDIVVSDPQKGTAIPKSTYHGIRESYHLLQSLALNNQMCIAASDVKLHSQEARKGLVSRYPEGAERSVLFPGHQQSKQASNCHQTQQSIIQIMQDALIGDRIGVIRSIRDHLISSELGPYDKFTTATVLPYIGYKLQDMLGEFSDIRQRLFAEIKAIATVPELVSAYEFASRTNDDRLLRAAMTHAEGLPLQDEVRRQLMRNYRSASFPLNRLAAKLTNRFLK